MTETKRERFLRLRDSRLEKFRNLIRLFSNFRNGSAYEYTEADVKELIQELHREIDDLEIVLMEKRKFKLIS